MRSRDGTQTICVVCEPKPTAPVAVLDTPKESTTIKALESAIAPSSSPGSPSIAKVLLETLLNSLNSSHSIDLFADILEAALHPLKTLNISNTVTDNNSIIAAIRNKINNKLSQSCQSNDSQVVISYFKAIDRVLKISVEFDTVTTK